MHKFLKLLKLLCTILYNGAPKSRVTNTYVSVLYNFTQKCRCKLCMQHNNMSEFFLFQNVLVLYLSPFCFNDSSTGANMNTMIFSCLNYRFSVGSDLWNPWPV